jgi:glucosamine--fructose-6-phosphate aminotransferase (isomerizing)
MTRYLRADIFIIFFGNFQMIWKLLLVPADLSPSNGERMTSFMRAETLESAESVRRCLTQKAVFTALGERLRELDPPFAVVCARGSSSHAGTYLRVLLTRHLGLIAAAGMPSVASIYRRPRRLRGALFVAISQSGRSPDLIASAAQARAEGALTLALVNDPGSPVAAACELVLDIAAGPERSVAATKTVLATLAASLALVNAWQDIPDAKAALEALPERMAASAALDWSPLVSVLATIDRMFTVGRGTALGIVNEAALKLTEVCGIAALAFSAAELAHGPMTLAGPGFPALAFLQDDAARPHTQALLTTLAKQGAPVLVAGDKVDGAHALPVLRPMQADADLLPMLVSFYLAAEAVARARGLDPDHPPFLRKVTRTT